MAGTPHRLMTRKREWVQPRQAQRRHLWNQLREEWKIQAVVEGALEVDDNVLPLLDGVSLELSIGNLRALRKKLQDLHVQASNCRTSTERMIRCPVCDVMSLNPYDLLQHLRTKTHMDKERQVLDLCDEKSAEMNQAPSNSK
ncbi:hypothetical protein HPB51_016503 [Rhipicephalus microplus]|uniref:Uncharacterized protein n=1 Tax=Rhipicephalus microplus TaxID=6941 RepID=A0A9J6E273_RHIMP|nr:hypothetical protein HPB51_016503 [Rhipicephalus microplus]